MHAYANTQSRQVIASPWKADQNNFYMPRRSAEKETRHHTLLNCKKHPTGLGLLKHDQQAFKSQHA